MNSFPYFLYTACLVFHLFLSVAPEVIGNTIADTITKKIFFSWELGFKLVLFYATLWAWFANRLRFENFISFNKGFITSSICYLFPFALLCVLHNISQFLISVAPPLLQAVTWSASISANFQILVLFES